MGVYLKTLRMKTIRIAGVPEHYNLPFYQLFKSQPFQSEGVAIDWRTNDNGTGAMLKALENKELDMAVLLTEGTLMHSYSKKDVTIIASYVKSPLIWGVHTHANGSYNPDEGINSQTKFAISRPKSGSHLMAYLYAKNFSIELRDSQFIIVNNMRGAAESMDNNDADLYLWEKYTTKPLVDEGTFRRIDEFPTPWEPFVIAVRTEYLQSQKELVYRVIDEVRQIAQSLINNEETTIDSIVQTFHLEPSDVREWFSTLEWDVQLIHDSTHFNRVLDILVSLKIIKPYYASKL